MNYQNPYINSPKIHKVNFYDNGIQVIVKYEDDRLLTYNDQSSGSRKQIIYSENSNLETQLIDIKNQLIEFLKQFPSYNLYVPKREQGSLYPIVIDAHKLACNILMRQLQTILQTEGVLDRQFKLLK